jgi:hypothetical protein
LTVGAAFPAVAVNAQKRADMSFVFISISIF